MLRRTLQVLSTVIALVTLPWPTQAALAQQYQTSGFRTPSGNIHCMAWTDPQSPPALRCDIREIDDELPPRPADCDLEWGRSFEVEAHGNTAMRICVGDSTFDPQHPVLAYDRTWRAWQFTCASKQNGLTCRNADGHGFFLSRRMQSLF
jgi:hypothetical protein